LPVATQLPVVPVQDVVVIAVPIAVAGVILIVVIIILIVLIVAYCRKKKTSHKYVLNYHTVYGKKLIVNTHFKLNSLWWMWLKIDITLHYMKLASLRI